MVRCQCWDPPEIKGLRGHGKSFGGPAGQGFREQHLSCETQQLFSQQQCKGCKQTAPPWSTGRCAEVPVPGELGWHRSPGWTLRLSLEHRPLRSSGHPAPPPAGQGHIRAPASLPGERAGPRRVPQGSAARSREVPVGISSTFQPGATAGSAGVDQPGFAGCPSGIIGTRCQK